MVKKYGFGVGGVFEEIPNGDYVAYSDYVDLLAKLSNKSIEIVSLNEEIKELKDKVRWLKK